MEDGHAADIERNVVKAKSPREMTKPPPTKRKKLASEPAKQQPAQYYCDDQRAYNVEEELDLIEFGDEFWEEQDRLCDKYRKEILLCSAPPDPLDISHATFMVVHSQDLLRRGAYLSCFRVFLDECLDRRTLQVYDHPGDPRCGGFLHWENPSMTDMIAVRNVVEFAIKSCRDLCKKDGLKLSSVDKMSLRPTCHRFYYLTFTVVDELTDEETTFQAQIIEIAFTQFMLGLLRDASRDRVVAVMQIEEGPTDDAASSTPMVPANA